jgi:exopolysaccharide biosynthesis polyprenyl glycosylphosphotransferase
VALTLFLLVSVATPMWLLRAVSSRYAMTTQISGFLLVMLPATLWLRLRMVGIQLLGAKPIDSILVVGVGPHGRHTHRTVEMDPHRRVLGYLRFRDEEADGRLGARVLGTAEDLESVLKLHIVDEVYFAPPAPRPHATLQAAVGVCERLGVPFAIPACEYRLGRAQPAHAEAIADGYVHYLTVRNRPLQAAMKRLLDITVSSAALVLLSPLLIAVAAAVKLTSRGPVLFRQKRVGRLGRTFEMLKFRSMVTNAESLKGSLSERNEQAGPVFKMTRDPRVTAVGRFIRRHSIDELPQLVNVLRGDMSLVGPRPPLPSEVERYEAWQRRRLSVRPGLTCVWQVSGRNQIAFDEWMLLDMRYIDNWSLLEDLRLIFRTVPVVLTGRGAS